MSPTSTAAELTLMTIFAPSGVAPSGRTAVDIRHELVGAQVDVLRMYLEKQSRERLLEALDRLIKFSRASFRDEEELMECLPSASDRAHHELHNGVLARMASLHERAIDFDTSGLLAELIFIDRQLTSHISDTAKPRDSLPRAHCADCEAKTEG